MDINYQLKPIFGKENMDIGSLLRLFQSEYFTLSMHIFYLKKYFENKGIQDYLINQLYTIPDQKLEFYLPQLWLFIILLIIFSLNFQ